MSRMVFGEPGKRAPFAKRRRIRVKGKVVGPGHFGKGVREERIANRAARRKRAKRLTEELVEVIANWRQSITFEDIETAVSSGNARVIVNAALPNELEAQLLVVISEHLERALLDGVHIGLRFGPELVDGVSVAIAQDSALAHVLAKGASEVLGITQKTQAGIREILRLGLTDALAPVDVAQRIGLAAGLAPRDVRALENFRIRTFERFVPAPEALTDEVLILIEEEVEKKRDELLLNRGRTIAETEMQRAISAGEEAFWNEAIRGGHVDPETIFKTWRTVRDENVCPICEPLHGQTQRFRSLFFTIAGPFSAPPAHPRCRCFLQYGALVGGIVPGRPDRGMVFVRRQERRRHLDPAAVREDLEIARRRDERLVMRFARTRPGTLAADTAQGSIQTNADTIENLEALLREMGEAV